METCHSEQTADEYVGFLLMDITGFSNWPSACWSVRMKLYFFKQAAQRAEAHVKISESLLQDACSQYFKCLQLRGLKDKLNAFKLDNNCFFIFQFLFLWENIHVKTLNQFFLCVFLPRLLHKMCREPQMNKKLTPPA